MQNSDAAGFRKSREAADKCKSFVLEQTRIYMTGVEGDPSREMVIALAEVAGELGFNVFGKAFVRTLFDGLSARVGQLDDDQSLKTQLLAAGFDSLKMTKK